MNIKDLVNKMDKPAIFYDGWNMFHGQDLNSIEGVIYTGTGLG